MSDTQTDTPDFDHQRLLQMVNEFELELQKQPPGSLDAQQLSADIARLKEHLSAPQPHTGSVRDSWQSLRRAADSVENAVLKDSPYIAEMGRIIGLM
ncbi:MULTISPECIES: hypothetical protein [unclassified Herbaspirillum]|uniref:hypothetical protein n=1 Tax=unclassified Herbaspirillum TaxID=2624150 RepID=UPI00114EF9A0|nr:MULTISPECIES: hypothetical protein [unclassified Herbaspirillum]MBB5393333.1 hypothetical protein [Herbaspirillum sp. SJZ102]TQK03918.1 hypothetical protein FB599_3488 [Herbaspirillum sp. SJZ130]TQK08650.1 hypothetical protein FB598_3427 [Herbaspirillum sp. SJZ106]TWC71921.1 hypothetical protein FB597_101906 [Herbaspirillum sp. SJZ099]